MDSFICASYLNNDNYYYFVKSDSIRIIKITNDQNNDKLKCCELIATKYIEKQIYPIKCAGQLYFRQGSELCRIGQDFSIEKCATLSAVEDLFTNGPNLYYLSNQHENKKYSYTIYKYKTDQEYMEKDVKMLQFELIDYQLICYCGTSFCFQKNGQSFFLRINNSSDPRTFQINTKCVDTVVFSGGGITVLSNKKFERIVIVDIIHKTSFSVKINNIEIIINPQNWVVSEYGWSLNEATLKSILGKNFTTFQDDRNNLIEKQHQYLPKYTPIKNRNLTQFQSISQDQDVKKYKKLKTYFTQNNTHSKISDYINLFKQVIQLEIKKQCDDSKIFAMENVKVTRISNQEQEFQQLQEEFTNNDIIYFSDKKTTNITLVYAIENSQLHNIHHLQIAFDLQHQIQGDTLLVALKNKDISVIKLISSNQQCQQLVTLVYHKEQNQEKSIKYVVNLLQMNHTLRQLVSLIPKVFFQQFDFPINSFQNRNTPQSEQPKQEQQQQLEPQQEKQVQDIIIQNPYNQEEKYIVENDIFFKILKKENSTGTTSGTNTHSIVTVLQVKEQFGQYRQLICKVTLYEDINCLDNSDETFILRNSNHKNIISQVHSFTVFALRNKTITNENNEQYTVLIEQCFTFSFMEMGKPVYKFFNDNKQATNISIENFQQLVIQICEGAQYLHFNDIIHRDIKPDNIVITGDELNWNAVIIDYNVSIIFQNVENLLHDVCGTKQFIAPEISLKTGYNYRCDLYSLGTTIKWIAQQYVEGWEQNITIMKVIDGLTNQNQQLRMKLQVAIVLLKNIKDEHIVQQYIEQNGNAVEKQE